MSERMPDSGPVYVKGKSHGEFVAASSNTEVDRRVTVHPPVLLQAAPPAVVNVEPVWTPAETVREVGTPVSRAFATLLRAAPLVALLLPVSMGLLWLLDAGWAWLLPLWGTASIAGYLAVVWVDLTFNAPSATERHRITTAANLKRLELRQAHELRRAIVEAYLRHLEGK